jgi:arylsulfatase A-like enzyme
VVARSRAGECDALTTSVDLFATLADVFGVDVRQRTHGRSLVPLLTGSAT